MPLVRIIRAVDGLLLAVLALVVLVAYPTAAGRNLLGQFDMICVLPPVVIAWCVFGLPGELPGVEGWARQVRRVRVSGACLAALAPFVVWWLRQPAELYLLVNAVLAAAAGAAVMFYLAGLGEFLCAFLKLPALAWEARFIRGLVFWLLIVVGLGGLLALLALEVLIFRAASVGLAVAQFIGLANLPLELGGRVASRLPGLVSLFLVVAPLVFVVSLFVRLRLALLHALGEKLGEEP